MHYNENSNRVQSKRKSDGQGRIAISYPKYKERYTLRFLMEDATFCMCKFISIILYILHVTGYA